MPAVLVLNGPNLARLGSREPDIYGTATLDDLRTACEATASKLGLSVDFRQRTAPLVEVHLSNPAAREAFRHTSVVAGVADGTIAGFGFGSYRLALHAIAGLLAGDG